MKRAFLLIVLPALLVVLGYAQTPAASGNTDQINIKGCLGGSDGNYTIAEDNTGQIFKITTSSADLKPHVGQDVKLIGQKAGAAENSVAVTELNMISEHCNAAAATPAATVGTPSENVSTSPAAAAPTAAAPAATVSTPSENVSTPPAAPAAPGAAPVETANTPSAAAAAPTAAPAPTAGITEETVSTLPPAAVPAAAPAATASTPSEIGSAPAAAAAGHPTRPSARPRKPAATPAAAPTPAEPVSTPVADAAVPIAPAGPPSETASTPAAPAAKASTGRSAGMLVSIVVVVLLIGAGVPLYNRWRKRNLLEQTRGQNLSFTKEAKSDPGKSDTTGGRKAA